METHSLPVQKDVTKAFVAYDAFVLATKETFNRKS